MAIFKKYQGKKITARDKNWSKGTWYMWRRINGRPVHKALKGAQTKEQAEAAERAIIESAFNRRHGIADNTVTFASFAAGTYARYVEQHNVNKGAKRLYVKLLVERFGKRLLSEISPQDCRDAQWLFRKDMSASSTNRVMSTLSKICSLACEEGILDRNPMQYVKSLPEPPPRKRLLTTEEKERLWLELQKDSLLLRLVTLAMNLPLRRGQLIAITPDAVDLQNGLLFVTASKGRASRVVPLNSTAINTLKAMLADHQLPFPLKDFRKRWHPALIRAGINKPGDTRENNFHFHDLRKELATELTRQNVPGSIIQRLFAHSSMSITDIYLDADADMLKDALNRLPATELQHTQETEGPPN